MDPNQQYQRQQPQPCQNYSSTNQQTQQSHLQLLQPTQHYNTAFHPLQPVSTHYNNDSLSAKSPNKPKPTKQDVMMFALNVSILIFSLAGLVSQNYFQFFV